MYLSITPTSVQQHAFSPSFIDWNLNIFTSWLYAVYTFTSSAPSEHTLNHLFTLAPSAYALNRPQTVLPASAVWLRYFGLSICAHWVARLSKVALTRWMVCLHVFINCLHLQDSIYKRDCQDKCLLVPFHRMFCCCRLRYQLRRHCESMSWTNRIQRHTLHGYHI